MDPFLATLLKQNVPELLRAAAKALPEQTERTSRALLLQATQVEPTLLQLFDGRNLFHFHLIRAEGERVKVGQVLLLQEWRVVQQEDTLKLVLLEFKLVEGLGCKPELYRRPVKFSFAEDDYRRLASFKSGHQSTSSAASASGLGLAVLLEYRKPRNFVECWRRATKGSLEEWNFGRKKAQF